MTQLRAKGDSVHCPREKILASLDCRKGLAKRGAMAHYDLSCFMCKSMDWRARQRFQWVLHVLLGKVRKKFALVFGNDKCVSAKRTIYPCLTVSSSIIYVRMVILNLNNTRFPSSSRALWACPVSWVLLFITWTIDILHRLDLWDDFNDFKSLWNNLKSLPSSNTTQAWCSSTNDFIQT